MLNYSVKNQAPAQQKCLSKYSARLLPGSGLFIQLLTDCFFKLHVHLAVTSGGSHGCSFGACRPYLCNLKWFLFLSAHWMPTERAGVENLYLTQIPCPVSPTLPPTHWSLWASMGLPRWGLGLWEGKFFRRQKQTVSLSVPAYVSRKNLKKHSAAMATSSISFSPDLWVQENQCSESVWVCDSGLRGRGRRSIFSSMITAFEAYCTRQVLQGRG